MKKRKEKVDVAELVVKMQEQMAILEMKLDVLIAKATAQAQPKPVAPQPVSQPVNTQNQNAGNQNNNNNFRNKVMHKAICADCKKECEVPFKPSGERPVYCKECFSRRKSANSYKPAQVNKPIAPASIPVHPAAHVGKSQSAGKKSSGVKKKTATKKSKGKK